ncbi:LysR family transcriptional regulator [Sinomonas terrae]|uniref:LysR family transcriptional regulator n=1 Tax=Sinomonas terrae TaxID=2908838 RepID=A0ABS9TW04_9MICC|nr:LysR family transcriptional regulator [Sinomonas terrae]MCH6468601.1 LysR family transcriptional regulator [Sinomonas terrae]
MDIKQLNALLAVAETGSVTRAAQVLHLVQPAVTRQIRALESELGVSLFERSRNGMIVTEAGELLVEHARRAVAELERGRAAVRADPGVVRGIVNVGLLDSVTDLVAEPLVAAMAHTHPDIELHVFTAFAGHLRRWLYDGELDVALLFGVSDPSAITVYPVAREKLWAVAPREAGLKPEEPIRFSEVAAHPLVLPTRGNALRTLVDEAAARAATEPQIGVQTNSARVLKQLVAAGHGWTVLPAVCLMDELTSHSLSIAPLHDPAAARDLVLATPRTARPTPAAEAVAAALMHLLHRAATNGTWPSVSWNAERPS